MSRLHDMGGRLGDGLRYSAKQVYNTFPFPKIDDTKKKTYRKSNILYN